MQTVDRVRIRAPAEHAFRAASDVERWPELLAHYRSVNFIERRAGGGRVRMTAVRPFGPLRWPVWWESDMWLDPARGQVRYRHVRGITTGMDVVWQISPVGSESEVSIVHQWAGPAWPLIRRPAADWVIGPVFIHGIASRTLAGIARALEDRRE
jgi:uncharacterized membrane protein